MTDTLPSDYPPRRVVDVVLRDGSTIHIRPVQPTDQEAIADFLEGLSVEARALRFFSASVDLAAEAERFVSVDYHDRYAIVATSGLVQTVVGHAMYTRSDSDRAEVAFTVADAMQGHGLGTLMVGHLAEQAADNAIHTFEAEVLPVNHRMIEVFREAGFPVRLRSEPGVVLVEFPTSLTPDAVTRFEAREDNAAVAALRIFLSPRSVAVIGASRRRGTIGGEVFHNLLEAGFTGAVYPVNPNAPVVQSVRAYATADELPEPVDVAVIAVPADGVVDVARACGRRGVRGLVVISAGFAESGTEGQGRQAALLDVCRETGMRLIGPNCMGILNTDPEVNLNATFSPIYPPRGGIGFLSQSGALGLAVMDFAQARGLGLSSFVSVGNKADISGNDLLTYWEADPDTSLVLLYLESFGNPRRFARISRRVGRTKPIVAVKSGRSAAGARATSSHTGAMLAASDLTVDALFRQAGVIRTDSLQELFDVASLLGHQAPPRGRRVAILTNAGGPGILCADACEGLGLEVPPLTDGVRARLAEFLPPEAGLSNPVDMIASASAEHYRRAVEVLAEGDAADALVVIFIPPLVTRPEEVAAELRATVAGLDGRLPLLTVFMSSSDPPTQLNPPGAPHLPVFPFPEDAARVLARAVEYGAWRERRVGSVPAFDDVRTDEATAVVAAALEAGGGWMAPEPLATLLDCYGVSRAEEAVAASPADAGRVAGDMGGSVALKGIVPGLTHKTEAGSVLLGLSGRDDVAAAAERMVASLARAGHRPTGFLVQRMIPEGIEVLVGVANDPVFGPVVACGAGGTAAELLKDVAVRITPLTDIDAREMIRSLATFPLLNGYRGAPRADVPALEELVLRVGAMVEAHPEVAEMDLNPVMVLERGAAVVDARIRLEAAAPARPISARRT
jgi:acetate---CoA ligase (ADP-forming)